MKSSPARKNLRRRLSVLCAASLGILLNLSLFSRPVSAEEHNYRPDAMAHMQVGIKALREKRLDEAKVEFETVVKMDGSLPDAYNNLGLTYNYENKPDKAQYWYRKALEVNPLFGPALNNLGLLLYSLGKPDQALSYLKKCMAVSSTKSADLYYYIANAQRDSGNKAEARDNYIQSIKLSDDNAKAYSGLAVLDLEDNHLDDAFNEINKSIKKNPKSAFSYYHLGVIEERRGHKDAAVSAFKQSLQYEKIDKYAAETRNRLAALSGDAAPGSVIGGGEDVKTRAHEDLLHHDWGGAVRELTVLTRTSASSDPVAWNNLGLAYAGEGKNEQAADAYRKALQFQPEGFAEAHYNLGMILRRLGDNRGAEAAFNKAISDSSKKHKTNPYSQNMLGIILRERGDYEGADKAFRNAILQAGTKLPVAHFNLALLLEHTENSRDAVNEYKTYLKLAPEGKNVQAARIRLKRLTGI